MGIFIDFFNSIVTRPMGLLLRFLYEHVTLLNYGFAIVLFTLIIRAALIPLDVKMKRSAEETKKIQPQIDEARKMYKNDFEKLNVEISRIYRDNNVRPLAGGCLPALIQLPILLALFAVISQPMTNMFDMKNDKIDEYSKKYNVSVNSKETYKEIKIIKKSDKNEKYYLNFKFPTETFGINLGDLPDWQKPNNLWLIPILVALTSYISTKFTTKYTMTYNESDTSEQAIMQRNMMNTMMKVTPLMFAIFTFGVPTAMGIYWITGNIFLIFQTWFIYKFIIKREQEEVL